MSRAQDPIFQYCYLLTPRPGLEKEYGFDA